MSGTPSFELSPSPVWLPSMQAGEKDSRFIDATRDLFPDRFSAVPGLVISRRDGNAMTALDLTLATTPAATLDQTGLIPTYWFTAPLQSAGVIYVLTLTASQTVGGRVFARTLLMQVVAELG